MSQKQSAAKGRDDSPPPKLIETCDPPENDFREKHQQSDSDFQWLNQFSINQAEMTDIDEKME